MTPPGAGIHWANVVTSVRLVLALSLWALGPAASWTIVAIASTGATSVKDMGKVMGVVKAQAQGKADMGAVSARIKAALSA